jgi:hypothetical protein
MEVKPAFLEKVPVGSHKVFARILRILRIQSYRDIISYDSTVVWIILAFRTVFLGM